MPKAKDSHYSVLGVAPTASAEEVKRAYRKKARQSHPDAGGDTEEFKAVAKAYGTLIDPEKRRRYDAYGDEEPIQLDGATHILANVLNEVVLAALGNGIDLEDLDVVGAVRKELLGRRKAAEEAVKENTRRAKQLKKAAARLRRKNGKDNVLAKVLLEPVPTLEEAAKQGPVHLARIDEALKLLDEYQYDFRAQKFGMGNSPFIGTGWTFIRTGSSS